MSDVMELKTVMSKSIFDSAARDAAAAVMEVLDMPYNDELVVKFLATSDGKQMVSSIARMLSYFNEVKIVELGGKV